MIFFLKMGYWHVLSVIFIVPLINCMTVNIEKLNELRLELAPYKATLVAVSKTKPVADIQDAYSHEQLVFGENYVQELVEKQKQLPNDIHWHFIGHLQSNKAKQIVPFVSLIHAVDSFDLLKEVNKQAEKLQRKVNCLLQVFIADESTKFGLSYDECKQLLADYRLSGLNHIRISGLMGMATNTDDENKIRGEFKQLNSFFLSAKKSFATENNAAPILSMGMTSDYKIALDEGSNMIRIGSALFGNR
jgi:hypothetical protein